MGDNLSSPGRGHYTYKPLETPNSIRLLTLHPGARDDPIQCDLLHTKIQDGKYRALSYEWGNEGDLGSIISVNNVSFPRPIQKNLEFSLREIRDESENVTLWIDALCINQDDTTEKGHQVAMMRNIFREADTVIAWLGPAADNSELAMDLIADKMKLREKTENQQLSDTELAALAPIAYRSYWSRVWIIQEFFLAKKLEIRCGSKAVPYEDQFRNYLDVMCLPTSQFLAPRWKRGPNSPPTHTHMFARMMPQTTDPDSILHNAHLFSWLRRSYNLDAQASDPRDYIYALLGVSDDCNPAEVIPEYNNDTARDALLKIIPTCLKSMHPKHRKYSDRLSRAGFLVKYAADKMRIAIDAELQRDIARLLYIYPEDIDLEEEIGSEYQHKMYTRKLSREELTEALRMRYLSQLAAARGHPLPGWVVINQAYRDLFPGIPDAWRRDWADGG